MNKHWSIEMKQTLISDFEELLRVAGSLTKRCVAVVAADHSATLEAVAAAKTALKSDFLLTGSRKTIEEGLAAHGLAADGIEIVDAKQPDRLIAPALEALRGGSAQILLKGKIDTTTLMKAVLARDSGLRIGRLLSDIVLFQYARTSANKFLMITDGGLNVLPDLPAKKEIIENAVQVAHALGNSNPKVAVLSATEFVLPDIPSTVDAALLAKMNRRGQIKGCIVDGPFALDNALSADAADTKNISSPVAGQADILVAPNIESANMLAKSTTFFAGLRLAHVVMGAKIPILIPSRSDKSDAKLLSIALGMVMSEYLTHNPPDTDHD